MIFVAVAKEIGAADWDQVLRSDVLMVIDFWHTRCPWCLRLDPVFEEVAQEYESKAKFLKLNVLENPANRDIAIRYGVMSTPTLMFFCDGRPVRQTLGFMPKEDLKRTIEDVLREHKECIRQSTEIEP